ncbi:MAG TPA: hypothetical protein PK514_01225 [Spirochaetota bacterium]|nr:hypothetical protein [Spirochaetota bacterium]
MIRTKLFILLFPVLMLFAGTGAYAALTVNVNLGTGNETAAGLIADDIRTQLNKYSDMPDFTKGFANANTYASNGATMRGYQGYDLICIAVGTMFTVQAPSADPLFFQEIQNQLDNGDVYTGLGANPLVGQVGLNMGFIIPDLYIAFRFGKLNYNVDAGSYKMDYDTNLLGVIVDYQLIPSQSILAGILLWKGLNLESGFIYSTNNVVYYKELDTVTSTVYAGHTAVTNPTLDLALDIKSYIIPVEIYSAFRLFYMINFGVGVGMDYVYNNTTDLKLRSSSDITVSGSTINTTGTIDIAADTSNEADKYRFKGMVNVGVGFGPVFVDVPMTFYLDNGYAVGLSAGIVW